MSTNQEFSKHCIIMKKQLLVSLNFFSSWHQIYCTKSQPLLVDFSVQKNSVFQPNFIGDLFALFLIRHGRSYAPYKSSIGNFNCHSLKMCSLHTVQTNGQFSLARKFRILSICCYKIYYLLSQRRRTEAIWQVYLQRWL